MRDARRVSEPHALPRHQGHAVSDDGSAKEACPRSLLRNVVTAIIDGMPAKKRTVEEWLVARVMTCQDTEAESTVRLWADALEFCHRARRSPDEAFKDPRLTLKGFAKWLASMDLGPVRLI